MQIVWSALLLFVGVIYAGLVLMTYTIFGPNYRLRLDADAPLLSLDRLLVWLGVRVLTLLVSFSRAVWDLLSDASAEVGDWFVRRSGRDVQAAYRSRFL